MSELTTRSFILTYIMF